MAKPKEEFEREAPEPMTKKRKAPKSKHHGTQPFTLEVSNALRHHVGERRALESKREAAFGDRDSALAELAELQDKHSDEALKLKERHSDAIVLIEELKARIKFHNDQIADLVENADEPGFDFMYEPEDEPKGQSPKARNKSGTGPAVAEAEAPGYEGVDEHLKAHVNELDCREDLKGKLVSAGLTTIGAVAYIIDGDGDLRDKAEINENQASEIKRAVKAYRKKHRSAAREVESAAA